MNATADAPAAAGETWITETFKDGTIIHYWGDPEAYEWFDDFEQDEPEGENPEPQEEENRREHTSRQRTKDKTSQFQGRWPDEYETLPEMEFWEKDGVLPRFPEGAIEIMYADFGCHKTNTILTMVLDAALKRGAKVCYAAGEGSFGVGKLRIPAHCRSRGMKTKDLRGKF